MSTIFRTMSTNVDRMFLNPTRIGQRLPPCPAVRASPPTAGDEAAGE